MERKVKIDGKEIDKHELIWTYYRKIPVTVAAIRIREPFEVETLEGTMKGNPGDFLIRGVAGEYYPCKPDIFRQTYEIANKLEEKQND